jgi:ubiquinone biosynthesis protein Coq4
VLDAGIRAAFEAMTVGGGGDAGALAIGLRREITSLGMRALTAKTLHAAVVAPERLTDIYDNAAAGWLGRPVFAPRPWRQPARPIQLSASFWRAFWGLVEMPTEGRARLTYTALTARLAGQLPAPIHQRVADAALEFRGVRDAAARGLPAKVRVEDLARCRSGSLGAAFHARVLRDPRELEMLNADELQLHTLPAPLPYLNARILQCHTLWRLVAGYGDDTMSDIALAAFQMGQFGHHYSSLLNGLVLATGAFHREPYFRYALDAVFTGWIHGRETPPLLGVDWPALWTEPVETVRARLGVSARESLFDPFPAAASIGR